MTTTTISSSDDQLSLDFDVANITMNSSIYNYPSISSNPTFQFTNPNVTVTNTGYSYAYDSLTLSDTIGIGNISANLDVHGDANFEGDVKIKGKSLIESLEKIEEKLAILRPNEKLEEKWDRLRELRKEYMELEKEIIEKEKVWDILKK